MVFSKEDPISIQHLYQFKGYAAKRLIKEFPQKGWKLHGLNYLLKRNQSAKDVDELKLHLIEVVVSHPAKRDWSCD